MLWNLSWCLGGRFPKRRPHFFFLRQELRVTFIAQRGEVNWTNFTVAVDHTARAFNPCVEEKVCQNALSPSNPGSVFSWNNWRINRRWTEVRRNGTDSLNQHILCLFGSLLADASWAPTSRNQFKRQYRPSQLLGFLTDYLWRDTSRNKANYDVQREQHLFRIHR